VTIVVAYFLAGGLLLASPQTPERILRKIHQKTSLQWRGYVFWGSGTTNSYIWTPSSICGKTAGQFLRTKLL